MPAVVVDVPALLAERDENEVRKDFTPSERVAIARAIEAQVGERRGRPVAPEGVENNSAQLGGNSPTPGEETRGFAARKAGFSSREQMRRAESVVANGTPEVVEAMDKGEVSVSAAAKIAAMPKADQKAAIEKKRKPKSNGPAKPKAKKKPASKGLAAAEVEFRE